MKFTIELTAKQEAVVFPLFEKLHEEDTKAQLAGQLVGQCAIIGQLHDTLSGYAADFFFLDARMASAVNAALLATKATQTAKDVAQ